MSQRRASQTWNRKHVDSRIHLVLGAARIESPSNIPVSDFLWGTALARTIQRLGGIKDGIVFVTLLPDRILRVSVMDLTEKNVFRAKPQPRGKRFKVEWSACTRGYNLPSFGPRQLRWMLDDARPRPSHYWATNGTYTTDELRFRRERVLGTWRRFIKARPTNWPERIDTSAWKRCRPDGDERNAYAKKTQLRFNLDVNRALCKALRIPPDVARSLEKDVLENLNCDRADVPEEWRLCCATSEFANNTLGLPVRFYAERCRVLERAGTVELEGIDERHPVDCHFSPGNLLWEFWFARFLNRPEIGGPKRENPVPVATRIHGLKGTTVLHNCTSLADNAAGAKEVPLSDDMAGLVFYLQPLQSFLDELVAYMKRHGMRLHVPSVLDAVDVETPGAA